MSYYEVLLFLHVTTAIVWLGSGFFLQALIFRGTRQDDQALTKSLSANAEWMARRIFIPASLAVLVLGILLTIEGPWGFGDLWIVLGLVGYAVSFLVGIGFMEPEGKRIHAAVTAHGPDAPQVGYHVARINVVSRMELVVLFLVVAVMALKPTGDDVGTLVLLGAITAVTVALGVRALGRLTMPRADAPPAAATE